MTVRQFRLSGEARDNLHTFSKSIQKARATDLEAFTESFVEDTYTLEDSMHYWPAGTDDSPTELPYFLSLSPTEEDLISSFEESHPYTYLAHGSGRIVLEYDAAEELVVKVARWGPSVSMGNGVNMNRVEYDLYDKLSDNLDSPFLPIFDVGSGRNWIVQPEATPYDEVDADHKPDFESVLSDVDDKLGILSELVHDKQEHNIGYWDGDWYIIDYARFH